MLSNNKEPVLNGVLSNAFKSINNVNISWFMIFYNQLWHSQPDFYKWHEGQLVPVSKKGNTSEPNKWIGVTLMDIGKNIYSSIMCGKLFKIISKHGIKCNFQWVHSVGERICHYMRLLQYGCVLPLICNGV